MTQMTHAASANFRGEEGLFSRLLKFIARFWTEADKRVGDNIKYWR